MSETLKPCPFCGGKAERIDIADGENAGGSCIACTKCQASSNVEFEFKENFVSNWNRRVEPTEITRLRAELAASEERSVEALDYAARLASHLYEKHWRNEAPNWRLLDDLIGVLTQLDNMTVGLVREKPTP